MVSREEKRRRWGTRRGGWWGEVEALATREEKRGKWQTRRKDEAIDGDLKREEEGEGDAE